MERPETPQFALVHPPVAITAQPGSQSFQQPFAISRPIRSFLTIQKISVSR